MENDKINRALLLNKRYRDLDKEMHKTLKEMEEIEETMTHEELTMFFDRRWDEQEQFEQ